MNTYKRHPLPPEVYSSKIFGNSSIVSSQFFIEVLAPLFSPLKFPGQICLQVPRIVWGLPLVETPVTPDEPDNSTVVTGWNASIRPALTG
jgi:hypothetical protein